MMWLAALPPVRPGEVGDGAPTTVLVHEGRQQEAYDGRAARLLVNQVDHSV